MKIDLQYLHELTTKWGNDRKITTNGNVGTQIHKFLEEFSKEIHEADFDQEKLMDAIGDSLVVITMIDGILSRDTSPCFNLEYKPNGISFGLLDTNELTLHIIYEISCLAAWSCRDKIQENILEARDKIRSLYEMIIELADHFELDVVSCWQMAYNEIKDRKGELLPNGNFVKESDLEKDLKC